MKKILVALAIVIAVTFVGYGAICHLAFEEADMTITEVEHNFSD